MSSRFNQLTRPGQTHLLLRAAITAAEQTGLRLKRVSGRSHVWVAEAPNGGSHRLAIRTSKNRWFAFPPLHGGKGWLTLDDVDLVIVGAVNNVATPTRIEVFLFDSGEVRQSFCAAYAARQAGGHVVTDGFGMWIKLDRDNSNNAINVGCGLAAKHKRIADLPIDELLDEKVDRIANKAITKVEIKNVTKITALQPRNIGEAVCWARRMIAELADVKSEAVKIDVRIENPGE